MIYRHAEAIKNRKLKWITQKLKGLMAAKWMFNHSKDYLDGWRNYWIEKFNGEQFSGSIISENV